MLEAVDLECRRGGRTLFRGLSFTLKGGELLRVAGANGSGKTSLLRILCGLLTPASGAVRWRGAPIHDLREEYSRELAYLGHAAALKDDLTAGENLKVGSEIAGLRVSRDAMRESLARFAVPDLPVRKLSQGQKRRAALARLALSAQVPLWLLDEPFSALDAAGIEALKALIDGHVREGGAVVYSTHQDPGLLAARVLELA